MTMTLNKITAAAATKGAPYEVLKPGKYDAVLSAVITLEHQLKVFKGEESVYNQYRLLFELPNEMITIGEEELPSILSLDVSVQNINEKSKVFKIVNNLLHQSLSKDEIAELVGNEEGIKTLLGKPAVLTISKYKSRYGTEHNAIKDVSELDPRLPQPEAVRKPFIFSVANPDLNIFKNKVSRYTRDKIMSAVNADEFPKELHKAYCQLKEQEAANNQDNPLI